MKIPKSAILAVVGLIAAIAFVIKSAYVPPPPKPLRPPVRNPFDQAVAATGIIEAAKENVSVEPYRTGKVSEVLIHEGQQVKAGQVLYRIDADDVQAQLRVLQSNLASQQANLERLRHAPRPEDIPPLKAAVEQAEANYRDIQAQWDRYQHLRDTRAISADEMTRKHFALMAAKAQRDQAQANLKQLLAGTWVYDLRKAEADATATAAQIRQEQVLLAQSEVCAPRDGQILQVNTRPGQTVTPQDNPSPVLLGNTQELQVRIDIDEINASDVRPGLAALASLRGDPKKQFPLTFNRVIPYMVPKLNLTGSNNERVDVRVLQLIYRFAPPKFPVYVGQQVDVYLKPGSGQ